MDWSAVDVIKSTLLYDVLPSIDDVTGRRFPSSMQAPHIDYKITADPNCNLWVTITAINSPVRLIVWPRSHALMMQLAEFHGWPEFKEVSTKVLDKLIANNYGYPGLMQPTLITIQPGQTIVFHGMLVHAGAPGQPDERGDIIPCHRCVRIIYLLFTYFQNQSYANVSYTWQRLHRYIMPKGSQVELMFNKKSTGEIEEFVPTFPLSNLNVDLYSREFAKLFFNKS